MQSIVPGSPLTAAGRVPHGVESMDRCPVSVLLQQLPVALQRSLEQRSALKVIAGLMNFDVASLGSCGRSWRC